MTQGATGQPLLTPGDLAPFADIDQAKAQAMIADATAMAVLVAPCITDDDFAYRDAVKAILRGAVLRWNEAGTGALTQRSQSAGPFTLSEGIDSRQQRRGMFWPSEVEQLQQLCQQNSVTGAFQIDTSAGLGGSGHLPWCDLTFGAASCSCGVDIAGQPIFEQC